MGIYNDNSWVIDKPKTGLQVDIQPVLRMVYLWMGLGLLVTAFVALATAGSGIVLDRGTFMIAIFVELGLVFAISMGINKMSPTVAGFMFTIYAAINGVTLSIIFIVYDLGTISSAFFVTAALFGTMTVIGFTTKMDLTKYGTYFMMGLIGLVIAMVVNWFLGSSQLDYLISIVGVILFTALTAYDTQKIKEMANHPSLQNDGSLVARYSILGALRLYLDFINLFIFLLRLFGGRRR